MSATYNQRGNLNENCRVSAALTRERIRSRPPFPGTTPASIGGDAAPPDMTAEPRPGLDQTVVGEIPASPPSGD